MVRSLKLTVHTLFSVGALGRECPSLTAVVWQAQPAVMTAWMLQNSESQSLSVHSGVIYESLVSQRQWRVWI